MQFCSWNFREPPCFCAISSPITPIISPSIILIFTVNFVGAIFQLIYIIIFFVYGDRTKKVKMLGLLLAVFSAFGAIVVMSIKVFEPPNRQLFVGYLSVFSLISMFASPLFIIDLVIRTKSVEYMPFYLSLATFLMSLSFFAYRMFKQDPFISVFTIMGEDKIKFSSLFNADKYIHVKISNGPL